MSAVCVLTPVVIAAWPAFSAAVVAAAASMGYVVLDEAGKQVNSLIEAGNASNRVNLEISQSELVTDKLARDQRISVSRDGVSVTFARDERGKASLCVTGEGRTEEELRALGEELSQRVVQQYVYQRLIDEARARGFIIAEKRSMRRSPFA